MVRIKPLVIFMMSALSFFAFTENKVEVDADTGEEKTEEVYQLPDIEVTGVGFLNSIYKTSGSIQVLTDKDIKNLNIKTLNDLKGKIPGVSFLSNVAAGDSFLFIRGIGDFVDEFGKSSQIVIDGMPLENVDARNILLQDEVERIEILKGPQNILFGPYAKAGVINIVTKRPTRTGGWVKFGIGNDGQRTYGINYNHVLNDALVLGIAAQREEDDGWMKNVYDDKTYGGRKYTNYVLKAIYTPTDNLQVKLKLFRNLRKDFGPIMVTYDFDEQKPYDYNLFIFRGRPLNFWEFASDFDPITRTNEKGGGLEFLYILNEHITLKATGSYYTQERHKRVDTDASAILSPLTLIDTIDDVKQRSIAQDIRLIGEYEKWKWIVGYSMQRTHNELDRLNLLGINAGFIADNRSSGIYSQITWEPIKQLEFTAGARQQTDVVNFNGDKIYNHKYLEPLLRFAVPLYRNFTGTVAKDSVRDKTFLYSGTVTWKFTPDIHLYFNRSRTYKPAGFAAGFIPNVFDKELGHVKELGFKGLFIDNRLFFTAALFEMKYKDMQQFNPLTTAISNVARVDYKGWETDIKYRILPNLTVGANYTKISTKIIDFKGNDKIIGKKHPYFPHYTGSVNISYAQGTKIGTITTNVDYVTYGDLYADYDNNLKAKPAKMVNASIGLERGKHEVRVWGNNLLNKKYYTSQYQLSGISGAAYGRGRTFGVDYKYSF